MKPDRTALLTAVPVRNPAVHVDSPAPAKTVLRAPLADTWLKRVFGTAARHRSFELDDLGREVWDACNGQRTVETIIARFAATHRLNLREAEVAVMAFLQTLLKRNLIALAGRKAKGRKK